MSDEKTPIAESMLQKRYLKWKKSKDMKETPQDEETFPQNRKLQAELDSLDYAFDESLRKKDKK